MGRPSDLQRLRGADHPRSAAHAGLIPGRSCSRFFSSACANKPEHETLDERSVAPIAVGNCFVGFGDKLVYLSSALTVRVVMAPHDWQV